MRFGITDLDGSHQTCFGVVEDVAMKHPRPTDALAIVEAHRQMHCLVEWNVHGVFPGQWTNRCALVVEHLEEEAMEVQRM
jgi:hypothetical protein